MRTKKQLLLISLSFAAGAALYAFAVISTFGPELGTSGPLVIMALIAVGGLGVLGLGYASAVVIGGMISLKVADFIARFTRAKHVVEVVDEEPKTLIHRVTGGAFIFYVPVLVFIMSMTLGWDIHNLHDSRTSIFHPLLHSLDVFTTSTHITLVSYSVDIILPMIALIAIAGIAPSIALPYFRKFKITGVNSGPFHTDLLLTVVGFIVGLGAILTLLGLVYEVLWVGKGPYYYRYLIPAMLGFSLHYGIGAFLGRDKSENMIQAKVETSLGKRVIRGKVNIENMAVENTNKEKG
jgi:hypothetical protein